MNDEELKSLFSALDDVSASESLKSSTLDFIMSAAAAPAADAAATEVAEPEPQASQTPQHAAPVTAVRGGKARGKWRAMRVAALAACLALALTGGVAYGYPASTVLVTQGGTTVELQVNVFGQVLSASASDEETQDLINQMGLVHTSYEDSVTRVSDSLKESNPQVPVEVVLNGVAQAIESGDEYGESQDPVQEEKPSNNSGSLSTGEAEVAEVELPAVISDQAAPAPVVAEPEIVISIPEPSGLASNEGETTKPEPGNRPEPRETPSPSTPDPVEPSPTEPSDENPGAADEPQPVQPEQPVVIDEEPSPAQDENPADSAEASTPSDPDLEEEAVYSNTRPPVLYSENSDEDEEIDEEA